FQRRVSEPTGSSGYDESPYAVLVQSDSEEELEKVVLGADDHVVHTGSDRKHMDLDVADVSPQPTMEQLDEEFTAMAYPKVQENLKLAIEDQVLLEEPASSSGTLSSLQHMTQQQSTAEAMIMKRIDELEHIMANLIQVNKDMEERLDKQGVRLYRLEQLDIPQQVSKALFEALEKSMNRDHSEELAQDLAEARKKNKKSRESPKTPPGSPSHQPPPPPLPAGPFGSSGAPGASG
nr:hypothetical protein [Tanacetum cinerariifolium]